MNRLTGKSEQKMNQRGQPGDLPASGRHGQRVVDALSMWTRAAERPAGTGSHSRQLR